MELIIKFKDEVLGPTVTVVSETSSGAIEEKPVDWDSVRMLFENDVTCDTGWLPATPKLQIARHMKVDGDTIVCVAIPAHVREIPIDHNRFPEFTTLTLPIPDSQMWIRYDSSGSIVDTRFGCTKYPIVMDAGNSFTSDNSLTSALERRRENPRSIDEMRIYQFPYGNVFSRDHNICWGNCQLPRIETIDDISNVIELFFSAAVNGDLFASPNGMSFSDFLTYMSGKTELAPEDFAPTDLRVRTLRERITRRR